MVSLDLELTPVSSDGDARIASCQWPLRAIGVRKFLRAKRVRYEPLAPRASYQVI